MADASTEIPRRLNDPPRMFWWDLDVSLLVLGCALFGSELEWSRILMTTLSELDSSTGCGVWGTAKRFSAPHAALVNGTLIDSIAGDLFGTPNPRITIDGNTCVTTPGSPKNLPVGASCEVHYHFTRIFHDRRIHAASRRNDPHPSPRRR